MAQYRVMRQRPAKRQKLSRGARAVQEARKNAIASVKEVIVIDGPA